ncbi:MAG: hypothetical protein JXR07_10260 [Reichenbachiella sp.]
MRFNTIIFILLFSLPFVTKGQESDTDPLPHNSVYFEFLGNGILLSLNYERIIPIKKDFYFNPRLGIGYAPLLGTDYISFPIELNFTYKKVEVGYGITLISPDEEKMILFRLGYRSINNKGNLFRIGFTPVYFDGKFTPFGGISFGGTF